MSDLQTCFNKMLYIINKLQNQDGAFIEITLELSKEDQEKRLKRERLK